MQEDPITDETNPETDSPYIDEEDWQAAFEPYEGEPLAALTLAFHFAALKHCITALDMHEAIGAIDGAIDSLFGHSDFRSISRELFETAIQGKLATDKETLLRQLGIRI